MSNFRRRVTHDPAYSARFQRRHETPPIVGFQAFTPTEVIGLICHFKVRFEMRTKRFIAVLCALGHRGRSTNIGGPPPPASQPRAQSPGDDRDVNVQSSVRTMDRDLSWAVIEPEIRSDSSRTLP